MHLPLRATRVVTDPFVDLFSLLFTEIIFPSLASACRVVFQVILFFILYVVRVVLGKHVTTWMTTFSSRVVRV